MPTAPAGAELVILPVARTARPALRYPWLRTRSATCHDPGPRAPAGEPGPDYYDRAPVADEYRRLPLRSAARRRAQDVERALGALGVMAGVLNRSLAEGAPGEGGLPLRLDLARCLGKAIGQRADEFALTGAERPRAGQRAVAVAVLAQ